MDYIKNLKPQQYRLVRHAANQIAGRKAKRTVPNFNIPREEQHRARYSPFKDIADCKSQDELISWMKEDGHKAQEGGGLHSAFVDSVDVLHKHWKNAVDKAHPHVQKIEKTLYNIGETGRVQADVGADDFLHKVGLRHHKKYSDDKVSDNFRDHADLHKDAYLPIEDRKGTGRFSYMKKHSSDKYATYLDRNGKVVVAFRGTSPKQAINNNDLVEDVHVASGDVKAMSDYASYKNHVKSMIDEYGSGNVSLSGYSLGGSKAVQLTQEKELRSHLGTTVALAPGMSPLDDQLQQKSRDHKIDYFYHHNDGVANSLLAHSGANHTVHYSEKDAVKSHMLLDRLAPENGE